jgi:stearoyl-CoA desaturase (delta-9 desaturase)
MAQQLVAPAPAVPGVAPLSPAQRRLQRAAVLALTVLPLVGVAAALVSLWGRGLSGVDLALLVSTYAITGFGITVGFHRLLTHRSFSTPRWLRIGFAVAGSMAIEGSVISWVADHRRHHAFADRPGDPHSPHLAEEEGLKGMLKGLWHAHVGWLFSSERTVRERWAPDLLKDAAMVKVDRAFPLLVGATFVLPALLGYALTGTLAGTLSALLWGGAVRVFLLHHVTWSVNSICHYFGRRPFATTDESTNNWPLALISLGESWHNNHHAFPTSAIHGLGRFQPDPGGALIKALARLGLARDVHVPDEEDLASKKK